ncbi:PREDICTED: caspase-3-like [Branchiostoma belcheri]|uniref:Caspase-3-like n=1 Tax=Branchiostoma belcheri TaxID=7741 RepID=A0A6P4YGI9_BRABE|nr:PREDICTED: caspase-3-like [Branchiostoma belcheri]
MDIPSMNARACVGVSGLSKRVTSQEVKKYFGTAHGNSGIRRMVTLSERVLIEFQNPEGRSQRSQGNVDMDPDACIVPLQQATNRSLWSKEQKPQCAGIEEKIRQTGLKRQKRLEIKLQKMEKENCQQKNEIKQLKKALNQSSAYEMSSDTRGVAVIINNIRFEDMEEREGAERDTDRLREAFESLGFTARTFIDLDHAKMVATMKDQGKADHSNHDCFVCCIMSHGTMGKVFSSDDVGIDICELMKPVNAKKCPSLKGKPKLFFIQACQGEKILRTERFDNEHDVKPVPFICIEADFFLGLATVPGYVARRDEDGAPYVKHLAKLLKEFGPTHDLFAIMAMVCDKMNEINDDKFGWISSIHSTLRKSLIFKDSEVIHF